LARGIGDFLPEFGELLEGAAEVLAGADGVLEAGDGAEAEGFLEEALVGEDDAGDTGFGGGGRGRPGVMDEEGNFELFTPFDLDRMRSMDFSQSVSSGLARLMR
jgi:hypothetical protein